MGGRARGQGNHKGGRIRAFRAEEVAGRADAKAAAFDSFDGAGADARALRAERRNKGGAGYDVLRHLGLVRRMRRHSASAGLSTTQG